MGVPAHQRWMNDGKFDGGQLSDEEKALRVFYIKVMDIAAFHPAMAGEYSLHSANKATSGYADKYFAFTRFTLEDRLIVVNNYNRTDANDSYHSRSSGLSITVAPWGKHNERFAHQYGFFVISNKRGWRISLKFIRP